MNVHTHSRHLCSHYTESLIFLKGIILVILVLLVDAIAKRKVRIRFKLYGIPCLFTEYWINDISLTIAQLILVITVLGPVRHTALLHLSEATGRDHCRGLGEVVLGILQISNSLYLTGFGLMDLVLFKPKYWVHALLSWVEEWFFLLQEPWICWCIQSWKQLVRNRLIHKGYLHWSWEIF